MCRSLKENVKSMVNRKERIKKHLKNCEYFLNKYGEEAEEILNNSDREVELSSSKRIHLDVANGWAFHWINNPSTLAFFNWLNLNLKLPDRKQLAGPILDTTIENIENVRQKKLNRIHEQAELLDVMIVFPSGETLVWKAVDISGQRKHAIDIILQIKELLGELKEKSIKIAAISNHKINNENEELQANVQEMLEDLQDETGYITTEEDWQERLEEYSYTHPAVDINAKWNLRDIFIRELERLEFISVSSEFN
ncbi:hypothetical protein C1646_667942 [Rhizophagus diaphanus]|nr:hypothetical protein C1646_667942 [Rhizophagus diaphanus] [Rhizophagus sp. MUCL 43196]